MAQTTIFPLQYTGAVRLTAGTVYNSDDLSTVGNAMQIKSKDASVSVNGSPMFPVSFDDVALMAADTKYVFNKECTVALANYSAGA